MSFYFWRKTSNAHGRGKVPLVISAMITILINFCIESISSGTHAGRKHPLPSALCVCAKNREEAAWGIVPELLCDELCHGSLLIPK